MYEALIKVLHTQGWGRVMAAAAIEHTRHTWDSMCDSMLATRAR
ncbi:hypothetical protein OHA25_36155 [Nonomuraea sp. NBC_00507]